MISTATSALCLLVIVSRLVVGNNPLSSAYSVNRHRRAGGYFYATAPPHQWWVYGICGGLWMWLAGQFFISGSFYGSGACGGIAAVLFFLW